MKCVRCKQESDELNEGLCAVCRKASQAVLPCLHCGALPSPGDQECPHCGARLDSSPAQRGSSSEAKIDRPLFQILLSFLGAAAVVTGFCTLLSVVRVEGVLKDFFIPGSFLLNSVPQTTLLLFVWGVLLCLLRAFRHWRLVPPVVALRSTLRQRYLAGADVSAIVQGFSGVPAMLRESVSYICQRWSDTEDFSETRAMAIQESDAHVGHGEGINSLIALFVWGIPILGFIGTVVGIALAVGQFSAFLGGNIDDVAQIKTQLIEVTKGLAFAFNTTLLGLLCAFVLMLISAFGRGLERRLLQEVSTLITRDVLLCLRRSSPSATIPGR